ncbi:MAG TPA: thymidine phosphorylase, partial [Candidatus Woesebacteria bacterium]|nr:thymidine phosphorylase [Candidatus Woesebacteria bacterium]
DGFSDEELYYLTKAMVETGTQLKFPGIVADKHSIGGIAGTRATMIVVPIITAAGYKMPKTSSRAITSPAGTADVMEVFAKVTFTPEYINTIVRKTGGCIVWGGHLGIAPADDVIIRVEEPLSFESFDKIIVSIMAKKIAVGANHLIIDIPVGKTMKVKNEQDAKIVKKKFEHIAKRFGMKILVDVNETYQPAGNSVGPFLEAIDVLKVLEQDPSRPIDLEERSLRLAGKLLNLCYETDRIKKDGFEEAKQLLTSGKALYKFKEIIAAQYGNPDVSWKTMKHTAHKKEIIATESGKIKDIQNYNLNSVAKLLGAPEDKMAGVELLKRKGDSIIKNEPIMYFYATNKYNLAEAIETIKHFPIYSINK